MAAKDGRTRIRIFLSSPGDCGSERTLVHEVVAQLNSNPLVSSFAQLEVIAWDSPSGVPLDALRSPQDSVNELLALPETCEIFVGVFRCKFGSPLPPERFRTWRGEPFGSGSEYEFHRAWEARRWGASHPHILMYRHRTQDEASCAGTEPAQLQALRTFFESEPFKTDQQWIGAVQGFESQEGFRRMFEGHLNHLLATMKPGAEEPFDGWLKRQAELLEDLAGPRYTPSAHVETDVGKAFDWLLTRKAVIERLDKGLAETWKWIRGHDEFESIEPALEKIAARFRADWYWHEVPDFDSITKVMRETETLAWKHLELEEERQRHKEGHERGSSSAFRLRKAATESLAVREELEDYSSYANKRVLLVTGAAGQGKTHTLVHEVRRIVGEGGVAVGVLGQNLKATGGLWEAITHRLDWRGSYTALLDRMESEAVARNQRALLVIDALNETPDRYRWREELRGMLREILQRPHVCVALAVRTDYRRQVLPELDGQGAPPWVELEHPGLRGISHEDLVAYFDAYGVKAPVAPPTGELSNPLYLQLLAKSMEGREIRRWQVSWLDVWRGWMSRLQSQAREGLGLDDASRPNSLRRVMRKLARAMLEGDVWSLPRSRAEEISREVTNSNEVIGFLCSAGALLDSVDEDDEEWIQFGYERLTDTFVVDALLDRLFKGLEPADVRRAALIDALAEGGSLHALANADGFEHPLSYHRGGLLRSLCLAVPPLVGDELPRLMPETNKEMRDWELDTAFIDSLNWRSEPGSFGVDDETLRGLLRQAVATESDEGQIDLLVRLLLIPGHPFAIDRRLHPYLLSTQTLGERDAAWSIYLAPLWLNPDSELRQVVVWARDSMLRGVRAETALPIAQLLAWCCASSQTALRESATKGLTRLLVACPEILGAFLPDFLRVNDPYVLESVLVAVWGVMISGEGTEHAERAARQVSEAFDRNDDGVFHHITLRHYAKRITDEAVKQDLLLITVPRANRPRTPCYLPLDEVPDKSKLAELDDSSGYGRIVFSSTDDNFYLYIMGGNSISIPFSSSPLPESDEPPRPFTSSEAILGAHRTDPEVFDLALAGRFVAWNCLRLGWTAERFDAFDHGYLQARFHDQQEPGRTERIGKKYQWIGWHTLLGYLSDHYVMRKGLENEDRVYESPDQLDVKLIDPSRWLGSTGAQRGRGGGDAFWALSTPPVWPDPTSEGIHAWIRSDFHDVSPVDVISQTSGFSGQVGNDWIRIAGKYIWESHFAPGLWGLSQELLADIWWQAWPLLIRSRDLSVLLDKLNDDGVRGMLNGAGRVDHNPEWHLSLSEWPQLDADWDTSFAADGDDWGWFSRFPVPHRTLVAECGHPDRQDEHRPVLLPTPSLFREWQLDLDLERGLVLKGEEPVFGLVGWTDGHDALLARKAPLRELLRESGYDLVWWCCGERRAFLDLHSGNRDERNWARANYRAVLYLAEDGRVQTAWLGKQLEQAESG